MITEKVYIQIYTASIWISQRPLIIQKMFNDLFMKEKTSLLRFTQQVFGYRKGI